jgi:hypothetical protein
MNVKPFLAEVQSASQKEFRIQPGIFDRVISKVPGGPIQRFKHHHLRAYSIFFSPFDEGRDGTVEKRVTVRFGFLSTSAFTFSNFH